MHKPLVMITPNKRFYFLFFSLFSLLNAFSADRAFCSPGDTTIYYFRHRPRVHNPYGAEGDKTDLPDILVHTLMEADYFRVITPSTEQGKVNIQEYYATGKPKRLGIAYSDDQGNLMSTFIHLTGNCATYYPDGKKQSIVHYDKNGGKDGDEYDFYPNGKIYCYKKNSSKGYYMISDSLNMECYDKQGNMICKDGTGQWIIYDNSFNTILIQGPISKGLPDGIWSGNTYRPDSIKYSLLYKKGEIIKQTGYDKNGTAYVFKHEYERAAYATKIPLVFVEMFRNRLEIPRDENGKKTVIDTMHISFIIEKDGHPTNFKVLGDVSLQVQDAFLSAFNKGHDWVPAKYFGIPFRTLIVLPLKVNSTSSYKSNIYLNASSNLEHSITSSYTEGIYYYEKMLDF
jgi:antitoxin component YwqK of YwqJK toxin-antitoxin module